MRVREARRGRRPDAMVGPWLLRALPAWALVLGVLGAGCGAKFELPTERREAHKVPGAGTYQMITTRAGLPGIADILLTPSGELFLLFKAASGLPARVQEYPPGLTNPLSTEFRGLVNPNAMAFGANQLFVLDQGDTNAARTDLPTTYNADCGPVSGFTRPIADVSKYWHVRAYRLDGVPVGEFTDTLFLWVNGIAADAAGRVYVGGTIVYCSVDPFDQRIRTLDTQFRIYRYERGPTSGNVIGDNWRRDPGYEVIEGTGIGSTKDPRGMQWAAAQGAALYFADAGNHEVQKFPDPVSGGGLPFKLDFGGSGTDSLPLSSPIDVAVDSAGFVYVADFGNRRVLRYDPDGNFVQRVDIENDASDRPIDRPIAVAANNLQVYVADPALREVVRYRRRKL